MPARSTAASISARSDPMCALPSPALAHRAAAEAARAEDRVGAADLAEPVRFLPTTPWAFLWHFVRERFAARYACMMLAVVAAQICQTLDPYILKLLINQVMDALRVPVDARVSGPIFGMFALMVALWFADTFLVRIYQLI